MPMPLSLTTSRTSPPPPRTASLMVPPAGVYLAALLSTLTSTCTSRL
jgi:hypothetical protein